MSTWRESFSEKSSADITSLLAITQLAQEGARTLAQLCLTPKPVFHLLRSRDQKGIKPACEKGVGGEARAGRMEICAQTMAMD